MGEFHLANVNLSVGEGISYLKIPTTRTSSGPSQTNPDHYIDDVVTGSDEVIYPRLSFNVSWNYYHIDSKKYALGLEVQPSIGASAGAGLNCFLEAGLEVSPLNFSILAQGFNKISVGPSGIIKGIFNTESENGFDHFYVAGPGVNISAMWPFKIKDSLFWMGLRATFSGLYNSSLEEWFFCPEVLLSFGFFEKVN